jgi:alcohol dehydrogenase
MTYFAILRAPSQVLFGAGMAAAAGPIAAGYGRRALVCTDPIIAETPGFATVRAALADAGLEVVVFSEAAVDVPRTAIDAAVALGRAEAPDVVVAVGGGSVIDLAKMVALLLAHDGPLESYYPLQSVPGPVHPLIALPTTAGTGSEATPIFICVAGSVMTETGVASDPVPAVVGSAISGRIGPGTDWSA